MRPGMFTATALAQGAPLWAQRPGARHGSMRRTLDNPEVARRVQAGTRLTVHATPAYGGMWWQVQGGPLDGHLVRQHDHAWSVNGAPVSVPLPPVTAVTVPPGTNLPTDWASISLQHQADYLAPLPASAGGVDLSAYNAMIRQAKASVGTVAQQGAVFDRLVQQAYQAQNPASYEQQLAAGASPGFLAAMGLRPK